MKNRAEFIEYVTEFYGPDGIFDIGATRDEVTNAVDLRLTSPRYRPDFEYSGDTIDREWVRDIIENVRGER